MPIARSVHLVGSIGLSDAETVFRTLSEAVGDRAPRYPDGETGDRHYWIRWQRKVFDDHPDIVLVDEVDPFGDYLIRSPRLADRGRVRNFGIGYGAVDVRQTTLRCRRW